MDDSHQRYPIVEGTLNFRDLGGYLTEEGRSVKWRALFRSDGLHNLTAKGQNQLGALGISSIIDLRIDREIEDWPDLIGKDQQVRYHHLPMSDHAVLENPEDNSPAGLYRFWLDRCQQNIAAIFNALADPATPPAIIHCAGGKDRTGMIVGLLLRLLGVSREAIVEDYMLTNRSMDAIQESLKTYRKSRGLNHRLYANLLQCRPEVIEAALDYLEEPHGGAKAYMLKIGVGDDAMEQIRSRYLDQP